MSIVETFHGYIETTQDSLLVLEACRRCLLPKISRRLQEKERKLVRSGSVFVFDERDSGIKRWTDGLVWSPSRILGNFLIYRELDKRVPKRKRALIEAGRARLRSNSADQSVVDRHKERQLVGSLSDAYNFKDDGLIKKTMSLIVDGTPLHLISYYHPDDVVGNRLRSPSSVPELANLEISPELLVRQNFRIPPLVEPDQYTQPYYPTSSNGYPAAAGQLARSIPSSRSLSLPSATDYLHQPVYSRHNSISQFHHTAATNSHRASVDIDRSKPVFDPMYNVNSYTLPSPTSSPNTPLPNSLGSTSSMGPPPTSSTSTDHHHQLSDVSMPFHHHHQQQQSSSSFSSNFDQSKSTDENHSRILNLPHLSRQHDSHHHHHHHQHNNNHNNNTNNTNNNNNNNNNTSINSLLSNDTPKHHLHHSDRHENDHHHPSIGFNNYYNSQSNQQNNVHHTPTSLPQPTTNRLYSLDETAMQWM